MSEPALESLRDHESRQHDPVRYRYLETLAARLPGQPPAVQEILAHRLRQAVAAYAESASSVGGDSAAGPVVARAVSPMAQLNLDVAARAQADAQRARRQGDANATTMKSVREFGQVWSRIAAQQQIAQALQRGPENAGPLNPHKLMLRSLGLMRRLSPDYLRHFLSQVQSLVALEQAVAGPPRAPLRRGRARQPKP